MSRLYLPMGPQSKPYPFPQDARQSLLNRLWETRTLLPGARDMPVEQLRDYVQAQEAKIKQGYYGDPNPAPPKPVDPDKHRHDLGALKEYLAWKRRRGEY